MSWYRTGTVAVTNGSAAVAGTGTSWVTNGIAVGDVFTTDFSVFYEVQAIGGDGVITLDRGFAGTTATGAAYAIIRNFSPLSATLLASINALIAAYTTGTQPYELHFAVTGHPSASQVIYRRLFAITVNLPPGLTGSLAKAGTAATGSTTFTIAKNGTAIGTLVFGAGATVPVVTFTAAVTLNAGDLLTVTAPASADATLADIAFVLLGSIA